VSGLLPCSAAYAHKRTYAHAQTYSHTRKHTTHTPLHAHTHSAGNKHGDCKQGLPLQLTMCVRAHGFLQVRSARALLNMHGGALRGMSVGTLLKRCKALAAALDLGMEQVSADLHSHSVRAQVMCAHAPGCTGGMGCVSVVWKCVTEYVWMRAGQGARMCLGKRHVTLGSLGSP